MEAGRGRGVGQILPVGYEKAPARGGRPSAPVLLGALNNLPRKRIPSNV